MTLILSFAQDDYVFQVSDRRLTLLNPDGTRRPDPTPANKTIMFNGRVILSFTGLARCGSTPVDEWIATELSNVSSQTVPQALTTLIEKIKAHYLGKPAEYPGITVVAAGFDDTNNDRAFIATMGNTYDEVDGSWSMSPRGEAHGVHYFVDDGRHLLMQAPQWIPRSRFTPLCRMLRRHAQHAGSVSGAVDILIDEMRYVASRHPEVGSDLMVSCLPLTSVLRSGARQSVVFDGPNDHTASFCYVPLVGSATSFAPRIVMRGVLVGDIEIHDLSQEA